MRALLWALSLAAVVLAVQILWAPLGIEDEDAVVRDFCKVGNTVVAVGNIYALVDAEGGRLVKNKTVVASSFTRCVAVGDTVYAVGFRGTPKLYAIKNGTVVKAVDLAAPAGGLATDGQYLYIALNGKKVRVEKRALDLELVKYVELDSGEVYDVIIHPATGEIWLSGKIGDPAVAILDKSLDVKRVTKIPTITFRSREIGEGWIERNYTDTPTPYYMCVNREGYVYVGATGRISTKWMSFLLKFDKGGKLLSVFNFTIAAWRVERRVTDMHRLVVTCIGDYLYVLSIESLREVIGKRAALYVVDRNFNILHRFEFHTETPYYFGRPLYDGRYLYMAIGHSIFVVDPSLGDVFYYSLAVGGVYGRGYAVVGNRTVPVEFTPERVYFRGGIPYGASSVAVYVTHFKLGDVEVGLKGPPYKVYEGPAWPLWTYLDLAAGGATARVAISLSYRPDSCCDVVIYWGDKAVARGTGDFSLYLPRTDLIGGRYVAKVYYRGMYVSEKEFDVVRDTRVGLETPFGRLYLQVVGPDNKAVDAEVTVIRLSDNAQFTTKPGAIMLPPGKYLVKAEAQGRKAEAEVEVKPYDSVYLTLTIPTPQASPTPTTTPTPTVATPATTPTQAVPWPLATTVPPAIPVMPVSTQPSTVQFVPSGAFEQILALIIIAAIVAASSIYAVKRLSRSPSGLKGWGLSASSSYIATPARLLFEALEERERTDRRMRFWIWLIIGILTLGIGFFVALYFLIKRERDHFRRQRKLEMGIIELLKSCGTDEATLRELQAIHEEAKRKEKERNPVLWTILSLIPFVGLYTLYFLTVDAGNHAARQRRFMAFASAALSKLGITLPGEMYHVPKRSFALYLILTLVTLGIFSIYWQYVLFKDFNDHFEDHRIWEDVLRMSLQSLSCISSP